jgi:hypothetical protein
MNSGIAMLVRCAAMAGRGAGELVGSESGSGKGLALTRGRIGVSGGGDGGTVASVELVPVRDYSQGVVFVPWRRRCWGGMAQRRLH